MLPIVMDPRLCAGCRFVFEDPKHSQLRDSNRPAHLRHDYFASSVHHKSAQSFCSAVDSQCPICVTLLLLNCGPDSTPPLGDPAANEYSTYNIDYGCGDPLFKPPKLPRFSIAFFIGKVNFAVGGPRYLKLNSLHPSDVTSKHTVLYLQ